MYYLLPEIDKKQTKHNARQVLKQYRSLKRLTNTSYDTLKGIEYTDMPRSSSNINTQEETIIRMFEDVDKSDMNLTRELNAIENAILSLSNVSKQVLIYSYCTVDILTLYEVSCKMKVYVDGERIHYSKKHVDRLKDKALIEFAEAYNNGCLIALENAEKLRN